MNGKTKEQLAENTEYYAWELSKAKLADALNLPIDKINLVQMSSEEFACDKSEVLGKYDLVYIGGNTSALKDVLEYRSLTGLARWGGTLKSNSGSLDMSKITTLPIYTMYSHNGDIVNLDLSAMAQSPGPANSDGFICNSPLLYTPKFSDGTNKRIYYFPAVFIYCIGKFGMPLYAHYKLIRWHIDTFNQTIFRKCHRLKIECQFSDCLMVITVYSYLFLT